MFEQSQSESSENSTTESDERNGTTGGAVPMCQNCPASIVNNDLHRFSANRNSIAERRRLYEGFVKKNVNGEQQVKTSGITTTTQVPLS